MESAGTLKSISKDYFTGDFEVTFRVECIGDLEEIKDKELSITAGIKRAKRSLNANKYFHVLVGKLAEKIGTSKPYMKNLLIARYGQQEVIDDEAIFYKCNVKPERMMELEYLHTTLVKVTDAYIYKVMRGSSTYDTYEMSKLIDGTVSECKEQGIETLTPDEIERLKQQWSQLCTAKAKGATYAEAGTT